MPATLWEKASGPSSGLVQQRYVEQRVSELRRRNPELEQKIAQLLSTSAALSPAFKKGIGWLDVYWKIQRALQSRELTINFKAASWFTKENPYPSYTQMYDRAQTADAQGRKIIHSDALNPANIRARVDDKITFPDEWSAPGQPAAQRGKAAVGL